MYARVMHIRARPGKLDEIAALYRTGVAPALQAQEGFHSTLLLTDPDSGRGLSITLWETVAARDASGSSSRFTAQLRSVAPLLEEPPRAENLVAHQIEAQPGR